MAKDNSNHQPIYENRLRPANEQVSDPFTAGDLQTKLSQQETVEYLLEAARDENYEVELAD
jgi:hypothetical protein